MLKTLAILAFIGVSCAVNAQRTVTKTEVRGNSASVASKQGKDLRITGTAITKTVTMNGGNLVIEGSDCNITVIGAVNQISITGADIVVNADRVNSVKIVGSGSHVYYKTSGNRNGRATVAITGTDSGAVRR